MKKEVNFPRIQQKYKKMLLILLSLTFVCLFLGGVRIHVSGNLKGLFLVWNLFLAWIPVLVAYFIYEMEKKFSFLTMAPLFCIWLLFLPNAPYIITDLVHLRPRDGVPLWYDAIVLFLFAFHGMLLGIISCLFVHEILDKRLNVLTSWVLLSISFVLTGYGIYLGRFLRWNSWDIVVRPIDLIQVALLKLTSPLAIVVTGIFSIILFFSYLIFYHLIHLKNNNHASEIL